MKTLVILHGWQSSKEKWEKVKKEIEVSGIKVLVPDIPGFKQENELKRPWDLNDYANWFEGYIHSQNLSEGFFLLGHSFGGALATKYILKNPSKINRLFLVAAACVRKKTLKRKILARLSKIIKRFSFLPLYPLFRKATYKFIIRNSDYPQTKGFLEDTYLNIINEDLSPVLNKIKIQTVLIWGDKDKATPLRDGLLIKSQITNSRIEIIKGADHKLNTKNSEKLAEIIIRFMESK